MRLAWILLLAACGSPTKPSMDLGTIMVVPTEYDSVKMTQAPVGATLDLVRPPQGGYVSFVGARVTGFAAPTTVELTGQLKDGSGTVISQDARTVTLQPASDDPNVWIPDLRSITTVSNIAVCPSSSTTDRVNATFTLEVQVLDRATGRMGTGDQMTTLVCNQTDATIKANCTCTCQGNYMVGKCP
jgi:hypothetical protein